MKKYLTPINLIFAVQLVTVSLIAFGLIPREAALFLLGLWVYYIIYSSLEDSVVLFVASIPIFVALPFSESFDSLSMARVVILAMFLKWLWQEKKALVGLLRNFNLRAAFKEYRLEFLATLLLIILCLSVISAPDKASAVKKIIYFVNLAAAFVLVKSVIKDAGILKRVTRAVLVTLGVVMGVALGQLVSVYFSTIGGFWYWWANHFSYGFYGENFRQIVLNANVWFAYSPIGPSVLRTFGSFTDSHSFALYLLLALPFLVSFLFGLFKKGLAANSIVWKEFRKLRMPAGRQNRIFVVLVFILLAVLFFIILSGTRGIWAALVFAFGACAYLFWKKKDLNRAVSSYIIVLLIFVGLIPVVSTFTIIPQFREQAASQRTDMTLVLRRLASILDLEETSNQGRIFIWKKSLASVKENPILGVGVGNFPVVLKQNVELAKAGSSAHNLYLNFAAESGVFAFLLVVFLGLEILYSTFRNIKADYSLKIKFLMAGFFVFFAWAFGYSLVDIALLDERVFLLFLTSVAIIYAINRKPEIGLAYE